MSIIHGCRNIALPSVVHKFQYDDLCLIRHLIFCYKTVARLLALTQTTNPAKVKEPTYDLQWAAITVNLVIKTKEAMIVRLFFQYILCPQLTFVS